MRFAFATDFHVTDQLGRYRRDCLDDILAKVQFVVDTAAAHNCDAIIVGGDWFHSPKLGYATQWRLLEILDGFPQWVGVLGQHDVHGHDLQSARQSPAGALLRAPNVIILDRSIVKIAGSKIAGFSYVDDIVLTAQKFVAEHKVDDVDLVVYHALINSSGQPFMVNPSDLPPIGRLAACGDYHLGFEPSEVSGVVYISPGALTRVSPADQERAPKLVIGVLDGEDSKFTDFVDIPCRPASEVFDIELWLADKAHAAEISERTSLFANAVKDLGIASEDVMTDIVRRLGHDRPRSVVNRTLAYLEAAQGV